MNTLYDRNTENLELLNLQFATNELLEYTKLIERTISLSFSNIINLELFKISEIIAIYKHLLSLYQKEELLMFDYSHPFSLFKFFKINVLLHETALVCILHIPILNPTRFSYSRVYPLPNAYKKTILPPAKYHLQHLASEKWTEEQCDDSTTQYICKSATLSEKCLLSNLTLCNSISVTNDYEIVQELSNHQILVITNHDLDVLEDCENESQKHIVN